LEWVNLNESGLPDGTICFQIGDFLHGQIAPDIENRKQSSIKYTA